MTILQHVIIRVLQLDLNDSTELFRNKVNQRELKRRMKHCRDIVNIINR